MVFTTCILNLKTEVCNAPLYEKSKQLKGKALCCALDSFKWIFVPFPGATMALKMGVNELNEILLNSMPHSWYKQACLQGFYCETMY